MKKNIQPTDRMIRLIIAAVLAGLIFTGTLSGNAAIIAGMAGAVLALTAIIRFCPLYTIFKK